MSKNIFQNKADGFKYKQVFDTLGETEEINSDQDYNGYDIINLGDVTFENGLILAEGIVKKTLCVDTGVGLEFCIGQGQYSYVTNNSGVDIDKGNAVSSTGILGGKITVGKALAETHAGVTSGVAIAAMDIPDGTDGFVTQFAEITAIDTTAWTGAPVLYISADTAGELTNVRPEFPDYAIQVGAVILDNVAGVISIDLKEGVKNTFNNSWNGVFREEFDFRTSSNGTVITGSLEPSDGHDDMTMMFSDGFDLLVTTPPATIALTPGTDIAPQVNYVYIPKSTKVLTVSTSEFPTTFEHIKVAQLLLQSALTTQTIGALRNQNWNDGLANAQTHQGHTSHVGERIRQIPSQWETGVAATLAVTSDVFLSNTSGKIYQMHLQTFPAMNMGTGSDVHIVNDPNTAYRTSSNLNDLTVDANGDSIDGDWFNIVVWGVANKTGEASHLMVNLPSGSYGKEGDALKNKDGKDVYIIPKSFNGVGFLIARFTVKKDGATWTYNSGTGYTDLRGFLPNTTAGVGIGASGVTDFLGLDDTPSSYVGQALKIPQVNAGETALEFVSDIAGQSGGCNLPSNGAIDFTIPTTDGHCTGNKTNDFNCGYTSSAVGDLVYLDSSSTWQKADKGTSVATYGGMLAIALEIKASGNPLLVALPNSFVYATGFPTLTIGSPVYMDDAGAIVVTQPTTVNEAVRIVGYGVHADKIYFNPSSDYLIYE